MQTVSKGAFLRTLKFRPQSLIGKEIIYDKKPQKIADISLCGDYIFIDKGNIGRDWFPAADGLDDIVVIDEIDLRWWDRGEKRFTVKTVTEDIETLKKQVGQPADGQSVSLFETMDEYHKRVAELRTYIDALEATHAKEHAN